MQPDPRGWRLQTASLDWRDDTPVATDFDDVYFSQGQGLAESEYVFLQQNRLEQRFRSAQQALFTVAETGFGTGLNFLCCARLWSQSASGNGWLQYISVEKFPLHVNDLSSSLGWIHSSHPLSPFRQALMQQYPPPLRGFHYLEFPQWRIRLLLILDDALYGLQQLLPSTHPHLAAEYGGIVDAWFLDGFAPAKNPAMWQPELFRSIAQLSKPQASLATFTAAGLVKRRLSAVGFEIEKVAGFGRKRDMLRGQWQPCCPLDQIPARQHGWMINRKTSTGERCATVIGGGLAGSSMAYALARRGWRVKLLEQQAALAQAASGNDQGMLYTRLSPQRSVLAEFNLFSYLYALRFYQQLLQDNILAEDQLDFCGLLQLIDSNSLPKLQQAFAGMDQLVQFLPGAQTEQDCGLALNSDALLFPGSGWLSPPALCQQLATHPNIELLTNSAVQQLTPQGQGWQLQLSNGQELHSPVVVIANSQQARQFSPTDWLPLKVIRGQVSRARSNARSRQLRRVLCHEGYLTPARQQLHSLGATFDLNDQDCNFRSADQQRNLDSLNKVLPDLFQADDLIDGRAGLRCNSSDYLPLVGAVPDVAKLRQQYAALQRNARRSITTPGAVLDGLYISSGYGSRGLTAIPLCSEIIAGQICAETPVLPQSLLEAIHPARFIVRQLIRSAGS